MTTLVEAKSLLQTYVDEGKIPGASFAYVTTDTVLKDYVGYRELIPEKKLVEENTLYDMASCTKVVCTTTLILKLMEEDYFSLKTTVRSLLPDFPYDNITIEHLLTHTSGLIPDDKNYRKCTNKQEMYEFINTLPLAYETGTDLQYSDFGYILLGRIIEKFKGDIQAYAKEVIFDPLNMHDTCFNPSDKDRCAATEIQEDRGGTIIGKAHDGKAFRMGGISGNAGLFSTVEDISKFVQMLLKDDGSVLSKESINLLKTYRTTDMNTIRTLGWIANDPNSSDGDHYSEHCLYHTGFTGTSIYVDFDRMCGIVLLVNAVHPKRGNPYTIELRNQFHNILLSEN